jgi:hypothetical protein
MTMEITHLHAVQLLGNLPLTSLLRVRRRAADSIGIMYIVHENRRLPSQIGCGSTPESRLRYQYAA